MIEALKQLTNYRFLYNHEELENVVPQKKRFANASVGEILDVLLAGNDKFDFYATAGGAVEKCVAGAADNSFSVEPVQLSVATGLGVRYKLTDRIAFFAEPTVSHHFDTDSSTRSLRTERPTNLNLLCGVRMVY